MSEGTFIVFEGGDRVGKSTQARALARALAACGVPHLLTHEPGATSVGARLRELLLDPVHVLDDRCEVLLYAADKAQHVHEVVLPALREGNVVVCDRYVDSLLAYQGAGPAFEVSDLREILGWATGGLTPDLTILLDADPGAAVQQADDKDRLELAGADFHARVAEAFRALATQDPARYLVYPGLADLDATARVIRETVGKLIGRELVVPDVSDLAGEW